MLGLTRVDLPFLGNLRSNWVVVIGIELLSSHVLVWIWVVLWYIIFCHPCYCYGYADPISVENRILGDGNGIFWCDADGSRLCPV
jgi:hypothetical protein